MTRDDKNKIKEREAERDSCKFYIKQYDKCNALTELICNKKHCSFYKTKE